MIIRELKHQAIWWWRQRLEVNFCSSRRYGVVCQVVFVSRERESLHFGVASRTYLSLTSFSENCFNIFICPCYLFRSIFFHVVQIVYSDIDKKHRYFYFLQLWAKDVGAGLRWKAKVSLTIESFEDIPTENIFMHIFISLHFYLCFEKSWRAICFHSKREALPGEKGGNRSQKC